MNLFKICIAPLASFRPCLKFAFLFCVIFVATLGSAQEFRGALSGRVQDPTGARIVSAQVHIQAPEFSLERSTSTDRDGNFSFVNLPVGTYELTIKASGFGEAKSEVAVQVGSTREVTVALRPPSLHENVAVTGEVASITMQQLDTASAVHQAVISAHDLQELPLPGRSFANIAYLAPGTEPIEPSDPTKARITAVGTGGSSGLNNENSVDGGDNSDDYIGGFLQNFSPDAIQEFAFRTAQEDADTGRTTAGSVVIATRRGTDDWHGLFGFYDRTAALSARSPIDNPAPNPKQPFSRQNYIWTLGGPIVPGQALVLLLAGIRARARQHRLQQCQPGGVQRSRYAGCGWIYSRHSFDRRAALRDHSVQRLSWRRAPRLVAIPALAMVPAGGQRSLHHPE